MNLNVDKKNLEGKILWARPVRIAIVFSGLFHFVNPFFLTERERAMDLLPAENSQIAKKHGFRSLKLVNVDLDDVLAEQPVGVDYGRLDNGLYYYVRRNSKPRMRAALALAVKAGYNFFFFLFSSFSFIVVFTVFFFFGFVSNI